MSASLSANASFRTLGLIFCWAKHSFASQSAHMIFRLGVMSLPSTPCTQRVQVPVHLLSCDEHVGFCTDSPAGRWQI
ncbi:hypothetical protein BO79DRAFT_209907, partial [Aspergillus costaricaensis CBS 115574]